MKFFYWLALAVAAWVGFLFWHSANILPYSVDEDDSEQVRLLRVEEAAAWVSLHKARVAGTKLDRQLDQLDLELAQYVYERLCYFKGEVSERTVKEAEIAFRKAQLTYDEGATELGEAEAELSIAETRLKLAQEGIVTFNLKSARVRRTK